MAFLDRLVSSKKTLLGLCFGLSLLLHLPFMNLPPQSIHVWRQCSTLAVARNLYEEGMNPLRPRIDQRFESDGVTGMQFPAYEYLVALGYELFGERNFVHRAISFFLYMMGAWGIYELFHLLFGNTWAAALGAWSFCWSPELFFFGISALPDILALSSSIWGLYLFVRWFQSGGAASYGFSLASATLGGLAKIQHLVIGFPIAAIVLAEKAKYSRSKTLAMAIYAVAAVGLTLGWYFYAAHLIRASGLTDYDIGFTPAPSFLWGAKVVWHNAVSEIPELILNYATFIFVCAGVYVCLKDRKWKSRWFTPLATWGIAVLVYYFIELGKMEVHSYYLLPFLPPLLVFAVWGGLFLKDSNPHFYRHPLSADAVNGDKEHRDAKTPRKNPGEKQNLNSNKISNVRRWIFIFLLLAQPTLAFFRIVPPRFWAQDKAVPQELYVESSREKLEKAVSKDQLCVVGPDPSRTIYFYFLHKKGFGFSQTSDLEAISNGKPCLEDYIRRGARYLYTGDPQLPQSKILGPYLQSQILREGSFLVFSLSLPRPVSP